MLKKTIRNEIEEEREKGIFLENGTTAGANNVKWRDGAMIHECAQDESSVLYKLEKWLAKNQCGAMSCARKVENSENSARVQHNTNRTRGKTREKRFSRTWDNRRR